MPITSISPIVQAHQQQMSQQDEGGSSPKQQAFNKKFGDASYSILSSKYPQIMKYLITYKVLDSDLEKGSGTGAFIIRKGATVVYLPVIMASGKITSCEMMYLKDDQSFEPLNQDTIKQIESANDLQDPKVIGKAPFVDSTQQVFKDMFRPPSRSNVVIASDSSIASLPNEAKEAISTYFQENPEFLAKVAEFYPIEALGQKLAQTKVAQTKVAIALDLKEDTTIDLLRLSELTKEASEALSKEAKEEILLRGYFVEEPDTPRTKVASIDSLASDAVTKMNITEYKHCTGYAGKASIFLPKGLDITSKEVLIAENVLFTKDGYSSISGGNYVPPRDPNELQRLGQAKEEGILVSEATDGLKVNDVLNFGGVPLDVYTPKGTPKRSTNSNEPCEVTCGDTEGKVFIFYPKKDGSLALFPHKYLSRFNTKKTVIDGSTYLKSTYGGNSIGFIPQIKQGFVAVGDGSFMLPTNSIILDISPAKIGRGISTISMLQKFLTSVNTKITLQNDGVDIRVTDTKTEKTATFRDEAEYTQAMVNTYGLSKVAADTLLKEKKLLLLDKIAFVQAAQVEGPNAQNQQAPMPFGQAQQPQAQQLANDYAVDDSSMQAAADLQDEDLMDTGILASVASNDDIKGTLVDLLPTFANAVTDLGKTVLMFTSSQEELENHYGKDQYTTVLTSMRKIFTNLGKLVYDLKSYINMNQHK